ncbi:hypothetical protein QFC20_003758 [Naganishia adeliensis]|uniref:Uncharacterized protein n=1 Tax=Naganishia adeliensis TaxID=92952 RepID=A0ACC2W733_9TREE|nr:hypothetical protein QFC20_003758 [Naganishia adeliensis]
MPQGAGIMYIEPRSPVRSGFKKASPINSAPDTVDSSSQPKTPKTTQRPSQPHGKSILQTLLWLTPLVTLLPYFLGKLHYNLPEPRTETHLSDGTPVVSEANIIKHIQALEDIGYRIVGTQEAEAGELYVYDQVEELANQCALSEVLECNVWYQKGDGMHQFDIMDHAVLKAYRGIGNIILQISGVNTTRTIEGDLMNNAILLNAHIDSALPSPGAADVKAVINLEAAGSTGGALLFQATSKEMIEAYSKVPRPHGTVVAADIFSSGIIMSDTDFVQFEKYLGISGLDHFADTTMAVLDHLLQVGSPLNTDTPWSPPNMVYYSFFDRIFVYYSMNTAKLLCAVLIMVYVGLLATCTSETERTVYRRALASTFGNLLVGIATAVLLALFLANGLQKSHTWFTHEHLPLVVFGVPAAASILVYQYWLFSEEKADRNTQEHAAVFATIGFEVLLMSLMQAFQIRSAYLFVNMAVTGLIPLICNEAYNLATNKHAQIHFGLVHWLWTAFSMPMIVEASTSFLDIFVPLTGRMGKEAPTEIIIAVLSAFLVYVFLPTLVPQFHRFNRDSQRKILMAVLLLSGAILAFFASPAWSSYDATHPKRAGIQYMYNTTSGTHTLHVAQLDSGPGFPEFVEKVHTKYGMQTRMPVPSIPSDTNSDWDILYPISAFIEAEKFPVIGQALPAGEVLPTIQFQLVENVWDDVLNTRNVTLRINHEGLIYPVIAFSAEVLEWSFQTAAPVGHTRHYVKAASSPGKEDFMFHMSLKKDSLHEKLNLHWVGIDTRQMYPATSEKYGANLPTTALFRGLDSWLKTEYKDSMEVLLIGAVAGVVEL